MACEPVLSIQFSEAAPKDIFIIENVSAGSSVTQLTLDLGSSYGNMLFDTAVGGIGQNVAQPFERRSGSALLSTNPDISDGDTVLELRFGTFRPGEDFQFTIDVDDRLMTGDRGPTMIGAREIEGALVQATIRGADGGIKIAEGRFGGNNQAMVGLPVCP